MSELLFILHLTKAFPLSACVSFFPPECWCWENNLLPLRASKPCLFLLWQPITSREQLDRTHPWSTLTETDGKRFFLILLLFFLFFPSLSSLLVVETDWDVCQMTFLKNQFAALIPWVKANQRRVQKNGEWKTQIIKRNNGGWLVY